MSYKYKVNAVSYVGDTHQTTNEYFFADDLTSVKQGVCNAANVRTDCKGKKHIFSVASSQSGVNQMCGYLTDALLKQTTGKVRIKVQYDLKSMMEEMSGVICRGDDEADMSMIYIDSSNIYAAGFGDINVYHFSKKTGVSQKVAFPSAALSEEIIDSDADVAVATRLRQPPRCRCIGPAKHGDEYLVVGAKLAAILGDELIAEIFTAERANAPAVLIETAHNIDSAFNLTAIHISCKKERKALVFSMLALILAAIAAISFYVFAPVSDTQTSPADDDFPISHPSTPDETDSSAQSQEEIIPVVNTLEPLKSELATIASGITGSESKVAYYIKNLTTGEVIENNDSKMYSASLIKLYIMAEIYRQIDAGELVMTADIQNKLTQMITISDNDACNQLAAIAGGGNMELGFQRITENAVSLGCNYTQQKNDLQAVRPVPIPVGNFTSVRDCGILLEKIYSGELVNYSYSEEMLNLLKNQQRRSKIPKYLPSTAVVANKTGETSTAQNDVAIVYTDKADYIICIMINDYANSMDSAMDIVARMSQATYNYIVQ